MLRLTLLVTSVVLTASCYQGGREARLAPPPAGLGRRDFVQLDELRRYENATSLLDVLRHARPQMLRSRVAPVGARLGDEIVDVFINGHYVGGIDALRDVNPSTVFSVRMMQKSQAYGTYGGLLRADHALFVTLVQ